MGDLRELEKLFKPLLDGINTTEELSEVEQHKKEFFNTLEDKLNSARKQFEACNNCKDYYENTIVDRLEKLKGNSSCDYYRNNVISECINEIYIIFQN